MTECNKCGKYLWTVRETANHNCKPYECYMMDPGEDLTTYNNMSKEDQDYCRDHAVTEYNHIGPEYATEEYAVKWDDEYALFAEPQVVLVWDTKDVLRAFSVSAEQTVNYHIKELS